MSIQEDCSKSWLAMRAKALCNFDVFPPCMIIQIVGVFSEMLSLRKYCVDMCD